jgi:hypothetical protein
MSGISFNQPAGLNPDYANQSDFFDDFTGAFSASEDWQSNLSGTGAVTNIVPDTAGMFGGYLMSRGTTAASNAGVEMRHNTLLAFGDGACYFEARVIIPILSTGTQRFSCVAGFARNFADASPADGAILFYSDNVNSGKWQARNITTGGGITSADTGIAAVANTWTTLGVYVNAAGTIATYSINGVDVVSINGNLPTFALGNTFAWGSCLDGSIGASDRTFGIDWIRIIRQFATPRI